VFLPSATAYLHGHRDYSTTRVWIIVVKTMRRLFSDRGRDVRRGALAALLAAGVLAPSAGAVTISPLPGTPDASPHTQISFLGVPPGEIHGISVVGSRTHTHSGQLHPYASAPGASFVPDKGFSEGESVRVSALVGPAGHQQRVSSEFTIAQLVHYHFAPMPTKAPTAAPGTVQSFVSQPALKPPTVSCSSPPTASTRSAAR
jgi:hypothetical protein